MPTINETGHPVNVTNFKTYVDKLEQLGGDYNPTNELITLPSLQQLYQEADQAQTELDQMIQNSKHKINERKEFFDPLDKLVTQIVNYANSTQAGKEFKKDLKGYCDNYRGFGIDVAKLPDGTPDPGDVSTSHQSYVQKENTFGKIIMLSEGCEFYVPNEAALQISNLKAIHAEMKAKNTGFGAVIGAIELARIKRDKLLYGEGTGVLDRVQASKAYVKGVFGAKSDQYKMLTGVRFSRMKKKSL